MAELKDFLEKFSKILKSDEIEKDIVVKVFKKIIDVEIEKEDVSFKKDKLFIKSDVYLKSEIKLNKDKLLKEIKKEGLEKIVLDIN